MNAPLFLIAAVESALNRYLELDPGSAARLRPLEGRVLALEIRGLELRMYLLPGPHGVQVLGAYEGTPDTTLRATPWALARLALSPTTDATLFREEVEISGDTDFGQQFQDLLRALDIDWEEQLSRVTGDVVAHQVGNAVRGLRRWATRTGDNLGQDLSDYLHEESRHLPSRDEVDEFLAAVDDMRSAADRLEARVRRLQGRIKDA